MFLTATFFRHYTRKELTQIIKNKSLPFVKTQVIWAKLTRRAKAYSSSCSQVILVYLQTFRRNSLFCSQKSPKTR